MSLKLRRKLITFLTAFVLLFASLAVFVAPNNFVNVNAQVIEAQIVGVQDNYIVNAKVTFPVSISDPISAEDGVIIYPNGKVYKLVEGKEFTLSLAGDYTLRYFGANSRFSPLAVGVYGFGRKTEIFIQNLVAHCFGINARFLNRIQNAPCRTSAARVLYCYFKKNLLRCARRPCRLHSRSQRRCGMRNPRSAQRRPP